jgi:hypothetical protein
MNSPHNLAQPGVITNGAPTCGRTGESGWRLSAWRDGAVGDAAAGSDANQCRHTTVMNVDHVPGDLTVPSFGHVCTKSGSIGADARPNWQERPNLSSFPGRGRGLPAEKTPHGGGAKVTAMVCPTLAATSAYLAAGPAQCGPPPR